MIYKTSEWLLIPTGSSTSMAVYSFTDTIKSSAVEYVISTKEDILSSQAKDVFVAIGTHLFGFIYATDGSGFPNISDIPLTPFDTFDEALMFAERLHWGQGSFPDEFTDIAVTVNDYIDGRLVLDTNGLLDLMPLSGGISIHFRCEDDRLKYLLSK